MFKNEILPQNGKIKLTDDPGWGLKLDRSDLKLNRIFASTE
jgi:L-alanine-DL-glutamate epimerase-like enolase superfamily enzyme